MFTEFFHPWMTDFPYTKCNTNMEPYTYYIHYTYFMFYRCGFFINKVTYIICFVFVISLWLDIKRKGEDFANNKNIFKNIFYI